MIIDPDDHPERHSNSSEAFADAARRLRDDVLTDPDTLIVYVMVGPPGAGKSAWAKEAERGQTRIAIVDGCHAVAAARRNLAARIKEAGKTPKAVHVKTSLDECLRRNNARQPPKRVPSPVVKRQYAELVKRPPRRVEGWADVIEVEP